MKIDELLDRAKAKIDPQSDYELARRIGVEPSAISNYRHGRSKPDTDALLGLAELLEVDALPLIAQANIERAKKERERKFWKTFLTRAASVAVCMLLIGLLFSAPSAALDTGENIHYAQLLAALVAVYWFTQGRRPRRR